MDSEETWSCSPQMTAERWPALGGQGIGSALAKHALDYARENKLEVVPSCPFIAAYIRSHPDYSDLVAPGAR